jgi:putative ABC transport system ATP-binding protein
MLRFRRVTKTYPDGPGTITALNALDLDVCDGSFVAVMGPSGSGKTTLALIAGGIETPTAGEVWLNDLDVTHATDGKRAVLRRRQIGVVFQTDELDPVLSAAENVALPLRLDGWSRARANAAASDALRRCGIDELGDRLPSELSGGQRQRVAIARSIVGERTLVVADEPTASVDTATARAIVELLVSLTTTGVAVLMTTHDSRLASFADEVVLLRDGSRIYQHPVGQ